MGEPTFSIIVFHQITIFQCLTVFQEGGNKYFCKSKFITHSNTISECHHQIKNSVQHSKNDWVALFKSKKSNISWINSLLFT